MTLSLQNSITAADDSQLSLDGFSENSTDYELSSPLPTKKLRPKSDNNEPVFDRFVSLAKRLFGVPIALVTIVDIDRSWFKTNMGLEGAIEIIQDASLCAYAILPDSPDVFVVPDGRQDARFLSNPLITGPPYIRFYAGAALLVNDIKIGSLCIIDTEPRPSFSRDNALNLMELGVALSNLVQDRKEKSLRSSKANAKMMSEMMQSLVYSVVRTNKATYKLIKEQEDRKKSLSCSSTTCSTPLGPCSPSVHKAAQPLAIVKSGSKVHPWASMNLAGQNDSSSDCSEVHEQDNAAVSPLTSLRLEVIEHLEDEDYEQDSVKVRGHGHGRGQLSNGSTKSPSEVLVSDLEDAVGHLKVVFESNICLSDMEVAKSLAPLAPTASMVPCDVLKTINHARSTLARIARTSNVVWSVDTTHLSGGSRHCVSLKSLYFVLLSMVERFIEMWTDVKVRIYFQKVDTDRESTEELYRAAFTPHISDTEESTWLKGRLMIQFGYSKKKVLSEEYSASRGLVSLHALNRVLADAGGGSSVRNWAQGGPLGSGGSDCHGVYSLKKDSEEILQMSECRGSSEGLICWIPCGILERKVRGEHSPVSRHKQSSVTRRIDRLMNLFAESSDKRRSDANHGSVPSNMDDRMVKLKDATPLKSECNNNKSRNKNRSWTLIPQIINQPSLRSRFGFEKVQTTGTGSQLLYPSTPSCLKARALESQKASGQRYAPGTTDAPSSFRSVMKECAFANEPFAIVDGPCPYWESQASSTASSSMTSTLFPNEFFSPQNSPSRRHEEEKAKANKEQMKLRASLGALSSAALLSALVEDDLKQYNESVAWEGKNKYKSFGGATLSSVVSRLSGSLTFTSQPSPSVSVSSA